MLVQLRKSKGFSAKQIAERTGWDKAFVSRLESGLNGFPDAVTVARYAEACGVTAGVVIGEPTEPCHFRVLGAVTLHSGLQEERVNSFERLADKKLRLSAPPFKAL
jgi:transcriptional regulator with XRE-family HTH domain